MFQNHDLKKEYKKDGYHLRILAEDHSKILEKVYFHLRQAFKYSKDKKTKKMLKSYLSHFKFGQIKNHKEAQKTWIKDINPKVETNIGFIETYLDPVGRRAEFEGFVAFADDKETKKYSQLVDKAEELIKLLPWEKEFEKDKFIKPNFANLHVLTFAGSGSPIGINIPNYDDIRDNDGYKNVNLGNMYPKRKMKDMIFLKQEDAEHMIEHSNDALTVHVALHELLGHGTGKMLWLDKLTGNANFEK